MTFLLSLLSGALGLARKVPRNAWIALAAALGLAVLILAHNASVRTAYDAGRSSALRAAAAVEPIYRDRVVQLAGKTDTMIKRVTRDIHSVDTLIERVPDTIRVLVPAVDTALKACTTLARDCDQLRADIITERTARDSLTAAVTLGMVARSDTIARLAKRPTRTKAIIGGALAAVGAFFLGRR